MAGSAVSAEDDLTFSIGFEQLQRIGHHIADDRRFGKRQDDDIRLRFLWRFPHRTSGLSKGIVRVDFQRKFFPKIGR